MFNRTKSIVDFAAGSFNRIKLNKDIAERKSEVFLPRVIWKNAAIIEIKVKIRSVTPEVAIASRMSD